MYNLIFSELWTSTFLTDWLFHSRDCWHNSKFSLWCITGRNRESTGSGMRKLLCWFCELAGRAGIWKACPSKTSFQVHSSGSRWNLMRQEITLPALSFQVRELGKLRFHLKRNPVPGALSCSLSRGTEKPQPGVIWSLVIIFLYSRGINAENQEVLGIWA